MINRKPLYVIEIMKSLILIRLIKEVLPSYKTLKKMRKSKRRTE